MRSWPRSSTKSRRSALIAMLCGVLNSLGPGFAGSAGAEPQLAVHHALPVGVIQRAGDRAHDLYGVVHRQLLLAQQPRAAFRRR
jgi:hypothetical protein